MFGKQLFEEVSSKISETIANSPAKDMEKNVKAMLGSAFNRMDLVTREEFDIQQQVLIKTRTKLAEIWKPVWPNSKPPKSLKKLF